MYLRKVRQKNIVTLYRLGEVTGAPYPTPTLLYSLFPHSAEIHNTTLYYNVDLDDIGILII